MRLRFWGTRGSLAKPGPGTLRYGGNTSCVQVETAAGTLLLLDCGTGAHALGQELIGAGAPLRGHVLISHTHWDHIQGIPFFTPLFMAGNEWDIYGPGGVGESLEETLAGQMRYSYFPVKLSALGAEVRYHDLVEGSFRVGEVVVRTRYLNHPALALAYRIEVDGAVVVYACDHEPHSRDLALAEGEITGEDLAHADFLRGADLVIHDAQYLASEYPEKVGWGHSTVEYAMRVCRAAEVRALALTHHDPLHDDDMLDGVVAELRAELGRAGSDMELFAAAEGQVIELEARPREPPPESSSEPSALRPGLDVAGRRLLVHVSDRSVAASIEEAATADAIEVLHVDEADDVVAAFQAARPSVVILDRASGGLEACRALRDLPEATAAEVPIILVAEEAGSEDGVTGWLVTPFSIEYVRSRIRAWSLRVGLRWVRAPLPAGESARLAALHRLALLDTAPEERFDRVTRLASGILSAPLSLVTLVDDERQWFKSRVGTTDEETPRDVAFCAYTILGDEPFVVPDTLLDDRFADNPIVADHPNVRFYAGCPVKLPDGERVGTLCVLDLRPRQLSEEQLGLLRDLADVVERELALIG